jgi:xanthine dehydrogenase YagR molybdenum-binding subunit
MQWDGNNLIAYVSTQAVSSNEDGFAGALAIGPNNVEVKCDYIGGGFGSKFQPDYWAIMTAKVAKKLGRPVKFMLSRAQEQQIAGNRPSAYIKMRLGADKDGVVQVWDSEHWGTGGLTGGGVNHAQMPYGFQPPNYRRVQTNIKTNNSQSRAWRAPNHPQGCAVTQTALDDLAMKMGADSLEIFLKNLGTDEKPLVSQTGTPANPKPSLYREEFAIGAKLIDWKAKWHPHGKGPA